MFLREYIRTLTIVCVAMTIYFFTLNQWVQWGADKPKQITENPIALDMTKQWWAGLYGPESWQNQQPRRLLLKRAEILYQSVEVDSPRRYKLKPLTILLPQSGDPAASPDSTILIECKEGAVVQFESDVSQMALFSQSTQGTSVTNVHLDGDVTITSIPLKATAKQGNNFQAKTSHLKIDGNRIWSSREINLRIGNSIMEGQDFEFTASSDILQRRTEANNKEGPFAELDKLEIVYVKRIEIEMANGGLLKKQVADKYQGREIPPAQLTVQCKKSFKFDFQNLLATFNDRVIARHVFSGYPTDQIQADQINLQFAYHANDAQSTLDAQGKSDQPAHIEVSDGSMTLQYMEAFGKSTDNTNDESRWIDIKAPNFMATCATRYIKVMLDKYSVELANRLPTEQSIESSPISLQREDIKIWSPKLIYEMAPKVDGASSHHLGTLWAQGPGEAAMISSEGERWTANWSNSLTLQPDKEEDRVLLEGAAQIRSDRQGRFSAERFEVWIRAFFENGIAATGQTPPPPDASVDYLPTRMQADTDVIVVSNSLRAQVGSLKLWFEHIFGGGEQPKSAAPNVTDTTINQPSANAINQAVSNPHVNMVSQTPGLQAPSESSPTNRRALFSDTVTVTGASLEAKMVLPPVGDAIIDHLILQDGVTMTKERLSETLALPVTVTGDKVVLERSNDSDLVFHIYGQPAKVLVGGGNIIVPSIHFDQQRQFLFLEGAGEMTVPPEMLVPASQRPAPQPTMLGGGPLAAPPLMNQPVVSNPAFEGTWLENPKLTWQGQMEFDGHLARFSRDIAIRGVHQSDPLTLWHLEAAANDLYVEMIGNIFEKKSNAEPTKVQSLQLNGNVDIKAAQTDTDTRLNRKSLEHLKLPVLTIFPPSQTLRGAGPGSLLSRRFGKSSAPAPQFVSRPSGAVQGPPPEAQTPEALQCLHLTFTDEMDGSYGESRVTFKNNVAAILGPIRDWSEALDVDRINMPAPGQTRLETEVLTVFSTKDSLMVRDMEKRFPGSTKAAWEIVAERNLIVDSNTEQGMTNITADSGRYDALNEVLKVAGVPHQPGRLHKQASPTEPAIDGSFLALLMNLKTGEMKGSISNINGALPPKFQANPGQPNKTAAGPANVPAQQNPPAINSPRDFNPMQQFQR